MRATGAYVGLPLVGPCCCCCLRAQQQLWWAAAAVSRSTAGAVVSGWCCVNDRTLKPLPPLLTLPLLPLPPPLLSLYYYHLLLQLFLCLYTTTFPLQLPGDSTRSLLLQTTSLTNDLMLLPRPLLSTTTFCFYDLSSAFTSYLYYCHHRITTTTTLQATLSPSHHHHTGFTTRKLSQKYLI